MLFPSALPRIGLTPLVAGRRWSPPALFLVVGGHALAIVALGWRSPAHVAPPEPALLVDLVTPPVAPALQPQPSPRTETRERAPTRVARPQPAPPPPVLASRSVDADAEKAAAVPALATPAPVAQVSPSAAAAPQAVAPVAAASTAPRFDADYLDNPAPVYPPISRREREQGKVLVRVQVDPSGVARQVALSLSSGYERLDKAALTAVARWRFVPARSGSEPVAAWVVVPIVFSLKD